MNPTSKQNNTPIQSSQNNQGINTFDVSTDIESLKKAIKLMGEEIEKLKDIIKSHNHTGKDGSKVLENSIILKNSEIIQLGNFRVEELTDVASVNTQQGFLIVGKDKEDTRDSDNSQFVIEHQASTDGSTNQSFMFANRNPLKTGKRGSITSGGSTFSTKETNFDVNELVGAQLIVYSSDLSTFDSKTIISNNLSTITVNGTWSFSNSNALWLVMMPVYLGAAEYPWRQIYAGGQDVSSDGSGAQRRAIRLGYGPTSTAPGIFFGTGVPTISAGNGSLFLRTDGATDSTGYLRINGSWVKIDNI